MKKIKWLTPTDGLRHIGMIEENDDDLCATWVGAGLAEYVEDEATMHAQDQAEDLARRQQAVEPPTEKAVHESPVDRSMGSAKGKKGK